MQFNNVDYLEIVEGDINIKLSTWVLIIYWETPFITYVKGDWETELNRQEMKFVEDVCERFKNDWLEYNKDENLFINHNY